METFIESKELIPNLNFDEQRKATLKKINYNEIDTPIIELIKIISTLDYCFTLQCCYGHFLYEGQKDEQNIEPLPITNEILNIDYRITYIAFCIKENSEGKTLLNYLIKVPLIEPEYIQFGCAEWFWERQVNSFVLQVEPKRFIDKDRIYIDYEEALFVEKVRIKFFKRINEIFQKLVFKN